MELMTPEILEKFRATGSQENIPDPIIIVKYFTPWTNWTWYATEFDEAEWIFFGYVCGQESEWGYFSLQELQSVRSSFGLAIERDLHFVGKHISEVSKLC